jgi:hypothetical protein
MCRSSARARGRRAALVAFAVAATAPGASRAEIVEYAFEGIVTDVTSNGGIFGPPGSVQVEDAFTGRFAYEVGPGNPDQEADPKLGAYEALELVIDQTALTLDPLGISVRHEPGLPTIPPTPPDLGTDRFTLVATTNGVYPTASILLDGPFESAFTDDALPSELVLGDFESAIARGLVAIGIFPNPSIQDVGVITKLERVPEPGGVALALAAFTALALRRRKRA